MFALRTKIAPFTSKFLTNSRQFCIKAIYVGNLPWAASETDLKEAFGIYGNIDSVYLPRFEDGRTKGYGFVRYIVGERPPSGELNATHFPTAEEIDSCTEIVKNAAEKMNGLDFMGRALRVAITQPTTQRRTRQEPRNDEE
ncbi:hypothetical protein BB559_002297 [Furculomyces boomerangus]|uniref:RRM domain-containing protein n=2 Tax=Harpellales TaxID=61421 RepID=A0A2T9YWH1_9FUNG|nr:hypothetical protein BB559_002297 [Furculomyces boomerangus]PWA02885.1 hypothetical protein BB558_000969 [Smittium angustum]